MVCMKFDFKKKITEWKRVLGITKKPSRQEFSASAKITGIGMLMIGFVGFLIYVFGKVTNIF